MKKIITSAAIVVVAALATSGVLYVRNKDKAAGTPVCANDIMMCPDGTSVSRSGPHCTFSACKQELPSYIKPVTTKEGDTSTVTQPVAANSQNTTSGTKNTTQTQQTPVKGSLVVQIKDSTITFFKEITSKATGGTSLSTQNTSQQAQATTQNTNTKQQITQPSVTPADIPLINETRYNVQKGALVDQNNNIIYVLPSTPSTTVSASGITMATHAVNAVAVNQVSPVVNAIPINGTTGKYYLSENSFGNMSNCEFSNKLYILDTVTNKKELMYEENSQTIKRDDPRACNSEMYLLATVGEKLILKYHTIDTNMICESTWSEPEKTWYLDVTKPTTGTKRFYITAELYSKAEASEIACRQKLTQ